MRRSDFPCRHQVDLISQAALFCGNLSRGNPAPGYSCRAAVGPCRGSLPPPRPYRARLPIEAGRSRPPAAGASAPARKNARAVQRSAARAHMCAETLTRAAGLPRSLVLRAPFSAPLRRVDEVAGPGEERLHRRIGSRRGCRVNKRSRESGVFVGD